MLDKNMHFMLTRPTGTTIVTSAGAFVIHYNKDGTVTVEFYPEKPLLYQQLEAFRAVVTGVQSTVRSAGGLRQQAAKFLTSLGKTITKELTAEKVPAQGGRLTIPIAGGLFRELGALPGIGGSGDSVLVMVNPLTGNITYVDEHGHVRHVVVDPRVSPFVAAAGIYVEAGQIQNAAVERKLKEQIAPVLTALTFELGSVAVAA